MYKLQKIPQDQRLLNFCKFYQDVNNLKYIFI